MLTRGAYLRYSFVRAAPPAATKPPATPAQPSAASHEQMPGACSVRVVAPRHVRIQAPPPSKRQRTQAETAGGQCANAVSALPARVLNAACVGAAAQPLPAVSVVQPTVSAAAVPASAGLCGSAAMVPVSGAASVAPTPAVATVSAVMPQTQAAGPAASAGAVSLGAWSLLDMSVGASTDMPGLGSSSALSLGAHQSLLPAGCNTNSLFESINTVAAL